ncbi:MAG TPA: Nif3-like dinuclear metal center hexameric protein [Rheinheimera sp.]|nr:Nif3-like dinuclear metal center hexameric protein [Rheinheimera sp.]
MQRHDLVKHLHELLQVSKIRDYCPNGLQVEGRAEIKKVLCGVTASQALLDQAVRLQVDAVIVHHGYFWKSEAPEITGMKKRRLQTLLKHDINLLAYHLPLDVHPTLGNNAQLGTLFGFADIQLLTTIDPLGVVQFADLVAPRSLADLSTTIEAHLGRRVFSHDAGIGDIQRIAWCTGGGQGYIDAAFAAGAQLFISGEVSEQTIHSANEQGIHFIAAGHHATERYGIKALSAYLQQQLGLDSQFIDIDNPA